MPVSPPANCTFTRPSAALGGSAAFRLHQLGSKRAARYLSRANAGLSLPPQVRVAMRCAATIGFLLAIALFSFSPACAAPADALFRFATNAYNAGEYVQAAGAFSQSASLSPAGGTLLNLGNAEWQRKNTGAAILAWEQALWLDPFQKLARANLHYARRVAQIETPDLSWYEVVSTWLPANWWAWMAALSLWVAIGISTVPGILRRPKAAWHQAVAACALAVFLLSLPAQVGVKARARLGFIPVKDVPLRLTPTAEAQFITRLAAGEPARWERSRGEYLLVRTSHASGWVRRNQFSLICSPAGSGQLQ